MPWSCSFGSRRTIHRGSILALGSWHWLFVINIPLGLAALVIGHRLLPHNPPAEKQHKFDKISAIANALTFGLLIYSLEGFAHSENRDFIGLQIALLAIIGTFFIRRQLKQEAPILPVDLMRIPIFALSIGTSITSFTAQMLAMVSLPFFMQNVLHYNAVEIGLLLTPWPLATILTAPLAGRLVERVHPGLLGGMGMAVFAAGLFSLYILPEHPKVGILYGGWLSAVWASDCSRLRIMSPLFLPHPPGEAVAQAVCWERHGYWDRH